MSPGFLILGGEPAISVVKSCNLVRQDVRFLNR